MSKFDDFLKARTGKESPQAVPLASQPPSQAPQATATPSGNPPPPARTKSTPTPSGLMSAGTGVPTPSAAPPSPAANVAHEQCQPVLRVDKANLWGRIETAIEALYRAVLDACASLNIDAYVGRNNAFEFPFAVRFESWVPSVPGDPNLTDRSSAYISLEPKPWHRYEIEYTIKINRRGREKVLGKFGELSAPGVRALLKYLVRNGPEPRFPARIKQPDDPFWRRFNSVENKSMGTRGDHLAFAGGLLSLCGLVGVIGSYAGHSADMNLEPLFVPSLLALVIGVGLSAYVARQPRAIRTSGRPEHHPRSLRVYDSWQAVLFGAAEYADLLRQRFLAVLERAPHDDFKAATERIGYRVLDEPVVREQIVLTARRGIIYCQIYEFGSDLYVGWQSFLNRGRWIEKVPGDRGIDRSTGRRVEVRTVTPGWEPLCEYDYFHANCLTEWTHAQIVTLTKQLIKELQIDQEIDFKIVRGERGGLEPYSREQKSDVAKASHGLFRRKS